MEEQEQVVNPEEATASNEAVESQEVASPEQEQEEQVSLPEVSEPQVSQDLDEFGVPWKNRAMEYKRKFEKEQELKAQSSQQVQQPQSYSIEQLDTFAHDPNLTAEQRYWAVTEAEKLRKADIAKLVKSQVDAIQNEAKITQTKQQTFNDVVSRNPDMIIKDQNGNFKGWNAKSLMFQKINQYMQNPEVANHPRAWEIAEAYASRDILRMSTPAARQAISKANNAVKNLQKKTLVEGGGSNDSKPVSSYEALRNKVNETGSGRDASAFLKEHFKAKGILPQEE